MYTTKFPQPLQISQSIHVPIMLMQATTQEQRLTDSHLIVTLDTPQGTVESPVLPVPASDDESSVSTALTTDNDANDSSSDWDSDSPPVAGDGNLTDLNHERSISMASSYLPRFHKKTNHQHTLATFSMNMSLADVTSPVPSILEDERNAHHSKHNTEYFYQDALFYPHPNLQSLLFSHIHPFIENDYREDIGGECEDDDDINANEQIMDWYDIESVNKFKKMLSQLLMTASFGIREDEIYLMFSSPSPRSIIMHLRFGLLSHLCDTHIDRFGRRSFYYHYSDAKEIQTPHFFQHSKLPSELDDLVFGDSHLSSFIDETPTSDAAASPIPSIPEYYSPVAESAHISWDSHSFKKYKIKRYEPMCDSPIHNEDYSPIPLASAITLKEHTVPKTFCILPKIKTNYDEISLEPAPTSANRNSSSHPPFRFSNAYLHATKKTKSVKTLAPVPHTLTDRLHSGIKDRNSHVFGTREDHHNNALITPSSVLTKDQLPRISVSRTDQFKKRKKAPNRPLPTQPKPRLSEATRFKLSLRKLKTRTFEMSVKEFKSVNVSDILHHNVALRDTDNNYEIAKGIANYFDPTFGDTDTVAIVSGADKEPDLSYWLKGDYIRKTQNVGAYNKTICVYRACRHSKAKTPIVSQTQFEQFVRNLCVSDKNKSVKDIGDILDDRFGYGVHFARSTLKRCDYDIYCRYSDKYECSFTLPSGAYIVAWRR